MVGPRTAPTADRSVFLSAGKVSDPPIGFRLDFAIDVKRQAVASGGIKNRPARNKRGEAG